MFSIGHEAKSHTIDPGYYPHEGTYFVDCDEHCVSWDIQVDKVNNEEIDKYVHWPMGEGDPYWFTDAKNPQPNPAPFQKEIIGEKFKDLYNLTLSEIVKKNILN